MPEEHPQILGYKQAMTKMEMSLTVLVEAWDRDPLGRREWAV